MKEIVKADLPKVEELLKQVLNTTGYSRIERMGGLTNHTYHVWLEDGRQFAVRIPGEGTEELIVRDDERINTELACRLGVDAKLLYFGPEGSKVTEYIPDAVTMSPQTLRDEKRMGQVAALLRIMHDCGEDTGVPFEVFAMAAGYEKIIHSMNVPMFEDYGAIKAQVMDVKTRIESQREIKRVPCHNDPLCENWVEGNGRMYLIDWEYAGMNDGMWDVADVSIEAGFDARQDALLLEMYLNRKPNPDDFKHFMANKIYVDYLWTLWAKARVPYDGQPMEDWAVERYSRMKENLAAFERL